MKIKFILFILLVLFCRDGFGQISKSGNIGLNFDCETDFEIHPNINDFSRGNIGKIMIATWQDDDYYTPFQTVDGEVKIAVYLPLDKVGTTVYFRVTQSDPDDLSSYEKDELGGDNKDPVIMNGKLNSSSAICVAETVDGRDLAVAKVSLEITNQYAGDNYQVEATLSSDWDGDIKKTPILVAWKRLYIEYDQMYKKGATIIERFEKDDDEMDDEIFVDNTNDFTIGDEITIFERSNNSYSGILVKAINSTSNKIIVDDIDFNIERLSGIKLANNNEVHSISLANLPSAYGEDSYGRDGGAFVELKTGWVGSGITPKYSSFPSSLVMNEYCLHWFHAWNLPNGTNNDNIVQLVAASDWYKPNCGVAQPSLLNLSVVYAGKYDSVTFVNEPQKNRAKSKCAIHEIGHQFVIPTDVPHVDRDNQHVWCHLGPLTDFCIMSYDADQYYKDIFEFDIECLSVIREKQEPR